MSPPAESVKGEKRADVSTAATARFSPCRAPGNPSTAVPLSNKRPGHRSQDSKAEARRIESARSRTPRGPSHAPTFAGRRARAQASESDDLACSLQRTRAMAADEISIEDPRPSAIALARTASLISTPQPRCCRVLVAPEVSHEARESLAKAQAQPRARRRNRPPARVDRPVSSTHATVAHSRQRPVAAKQPLSAWRTASVHVIAASELSGAAAAANTTAREEARGPSGRLR